MSSKKKTGGISREELINKILNNKTLSTSPLELIENYERLVVFLTKKKFTDSEITFVVTRRMPILTIPISNISDNYEAFSDFGFLPADIKKMVKGYPKTLEYTRDRVDGAYEVYKNFGYTKDNFKKMVTFCPSIMEYDTNYIKAKIRDFKNIAISREKGDLPSIPLGLSEKEILAMFLHDSSILSIYRQELQGYINAFARVGFTAEEIRSMLNRYPGILKTSCLEDKLSCYQDLGILSEIFKNPINMRQSRKLTIARVAYLEEHMIPLKNFGIRILFNGASYYEKIFGVSNDAIITLYDLRQELEEKHKKMEAKGDNN